MTAQPTPANDAAVALRDWRADQVREWLLLLLRFAITRDAKDEAAALAVADEIDALGMRWRPAAPSFFRRTSGEVCQAITAPAEDAQRHAILARHLARIDDLRLKRAFQAAVDLREPSSVHEKRRKLWTGLR